ncbi:gallinacin-5-like [Trachemys scripta elegans]|uniref:gallinacin-5-like n=1 Tax=Trachemys scripta elegans TaxID=31138 RepID=UPI001557A997|nr:gallinacin-5-like [Trachemys scripta elegans]
MGPERPREKEQELWCGHPDQPSAMKILYLLLAVVFLVLQSAPGFTQAQNIIQCIRLGGSCQSGSCPSGFARIGTCSGSDSCCLQ